LGSASGGGPQEVCFQVGGGEKSYRLGAVYNEALTALAATDRAAADLVQLRYFGGLSIPDAAQVHVEFHHLRLADGEAQVANGTSVFFFRPLLVRHSVGRPKLGFVLASPSRRPDNPR
jgi:hypothetical protein